MDIFFTIYLKNTSVFFVYAHMVFNKEIPFLLLKNNYIPVTLLAFLKLLSNYAYHFSNPLQWPWTAILSLTLTMQTESRLWPWCLYHKTAYGMNFAKEHVWKEARKDICLYRVLVTVYYNPNCHVCLQEVAACTTHGSACTLACSHFAKYRVGQRMEY